MQSGNCRWGRRLRSRILLIVPAQPPARPNGRSPSYGDVARRSGVAVGVGICLILLVLFLYYAVYVLLLAFAGVLIAVLLRGSACWIARVTGMPVGAGLATTIVLVVGGLISLGVLIAPTMTRQANAFADRLPQALTQLEDNLFEEYPFLKKLFSASARTGGDSGGTDLGLTKDQPPASPPRGSQILAPSSPLRGPRTERDPDPPGPPAPATQPATAPTTEPTTQPEILRTAAVQATTGGDAVGTATRLMQRVIGAIVAIVVVFAVAIYLAATPRFYVMGFLHVLPQRARPRAKEIFDEVGFVLRYWMIAQLIPMAAIGVLTAVGLWLIGIEMWLTLGLLAALFNFIPNFGPLISFIPAVLFALTSGDPGKVWWVTLLYIGAQSLEGYVLTPLVQRRAVQLPPALLILAQVLMGILAGGLGVVLAAPLTAAVVVVVKMAWVQEALDDPVKLPSEEAEERKEESERQKEAG
jgi:predicted PurR-regulated permease PerM